MQFEPQTLIHTGYDACVFEKMPKDEPSFQDVGSAFRNFRV